MILCLVYGLKCIFYAKLLNSFGFNISRYKYKLLTCVGLQIITGKIIVVAEKFLVNTCTYLCLRCAVPYQEEREKKCLRITSILLGLTNNNNNNNNNNILLTAIGLSPGGSGYITCTQIWKEKKK